MPAGVALSCSGILSCGSVFIDALGAQPPAAFQYVTKDATARPVAPDAVAFTEFGTVRSIRSKRPEAEGAEQGRNRKQAKGLEGGSHAALYYKQSGSFFSALMVRCDTWAVQWAVGNLSSGCEVLEMHAPSAHLVVGICATSGKQKSLFVASRFDTPLAKKHENRLWRQFVAKPRLLDVRVDGELAALAPTGPDSFLVLTTTGSLSAVTVSSEASAKGSEDGFLVEKQLLKKGSITCCGAGAKMLYASGSEDSAGEAVLAAFTPGGTTVELVHFSGALEQGSTQTSANKITVPAKYRVSAVSFCGPSLLCVCLEGPSPALQFVTLDSAAAKGGLVASASSLVPLQYTPVASMYDSKRSAQTLICTWEKDANGATSVPPDALVQVTLSLADGPFTASALAKAVWQPLHDPYKHYGPRSAAEKSEVSELYKDLQMLGEHGSATGGEAGNWIPLELFYCLAKKDDVRSAEPCEVAVFSVKTAPFLHTRLIKQWHNATNGLRQVLRTGAPTPSPLSLAWNPRHLRRALRLMNQEELAGTFRNAASAARSSAYAEVATSAVDTALQIISLSRQMGAALSPRDVDTVAVLLRASRTMGHEALRYSSRMGMMLESTLQQRRMNRLLKQSDEALPAAGSNANEESEAGGRGRGELRSIKEDFFGLPGELRTIRTLQTRYTANTWTQPLRDDLAHHRAIAAQANKYMEEVSASLSSASLAVATSAPTWMETGRCSHGDAIFGHFESTLLASEPNGPAAAVQGA